MNLIFQELWLLLVNIYKNMKTYSNKFWHKAKKEPSILIQILSIGIIVCPIVYLAIDTACR